MLTDQWIFNSNYLEKEEKRLKKKYGEIEAIQYIKKQLRNLTFLDASQRKLEDIGCALDENYKTIEINAFYEKQLNSNPIDITVAIIVKDEERCIRRCLDSLVRNYCRYWLD